MIKGKFYKEKNMYRNFSDTFKAIINKHATLKEKIVRGNNAPFMTKELRKAIMNRSRLKKNIKIGPLEKPLKTGEKKQKNKCNKLCRKFQKYFKNILKISQKEI